LRGRTSARGAAAWRCIPRSGARHAAGPCPDRAPQPPMLPSLLACNRGPRVLSLAGPLPHPPRKFAPLPTGTCQD
jgi:hypothetical protein